MTFAGSRNLKELQRLQNSPCLIYTATSEKAGCIINISIIMAHVSWWLRTWIWKWGRTELLYHMPIQYLAYEGGCLPLWICLLFCQTGMVKWDHGCERSGTGPGTWWAAEQCSCCSSDEAQSPHAQAQVLPASKALLLLEVHTDGLSSTSRDVGHWPEIIKSLWKKF